MYISRLRLNNIKCLSQSKRYEVQFDQPGKSLHPQWIVFAGPNNSGKSTLLQGIAIAVAIHGDRRILFSQPAERWVSSGMEKAEFAVFVGDQYAPTATAYWERSKPFPSGGKRSSFPDADRLPFVGYGPFRWTSPTTNAQRDSSFPSKIAHLFRDDLPLTSGLDWLRNEVHIRALEGSIRHQVLRERLLLLLGDGLLPATNGKLDINADGLAVVQGTDRRLVERMGEGMKSMVAVIVDIVQNLLPADWSDTRDAIWAEEPDSSVKFLPAGVVLIDEVESNLHPSWQQRIGFWLKDHFPNVQFIVTTHSPFICQAADEGGLFRMPTPGTDGPIERIEGRDFWTIVNGGADDAVLTHLFGLDHSHSSQSQALRTRLAELEVAAFRGRPTEGSAKSLASQPEADAELTALRQKMPSDAAETALINSLLQKAAGLGG